MISALLWVETLINIDHKHYKKKDLNSWPYLRFDLIAILDKKFFANYIFGAQYLSVIKDDLIGAKDLYLRGLDVYPNDYLLNFAAGYHFYFELKDIKSSIKFFKTALKSDKAPSYLPSLVARLETERNSPQAAFALLLNIYQKTEEKSPLKKYYHQRLYDIKAHIDLNCLNKNLDNCQKEDFDGSLYIKKGSVYSTKKKTAPLKVFSNKKN